MINDALKTSIQFMREQGIGIKKIATELNVGVGTVYKAMDKELTTKIIQNAITTIIMDKQSSEVADGVIFNIHKVFSTPSGSWTIREKGKCYADWNTGQTECYRHHSSSIYSQRR